jgi:hypothetical protein
MERGQPTATAVAVAGKRIVAAGSLDQVKKALGPRPYTVDDTFRNKVVMPGFMGDTAYGTAPMLEWMVESKGIAPHVPVWDRSERKDGTLSSSEFMWDEQAHEYRCPQGHALLSDRRQFTKPRDRITQDGTIIYTASQHDCTGCPIKQQCCPNTLRRKITRSVHERSRDVAREIARRSRCCSPISNASSSSIGFACVG